MTSASTSASPTSAPHSIGEVVRDKDRPSAFFEAAKVSSVGLEMGVSIGLGWGLGYWLDGKYETGPWLMMIGLLFGVAAGFNGLIRTARQVNANAARNALSKADATEAK